ncbi:hypothetical protein [Kribbella sp. CA-293567]|uniref:hypothetical protein n=1 Tax=Kribbella sp. CA-293567 TaxID=3002436 RepID=UPI0022DE0759|nr:hypothetical protein [Kribbella sp. CA-293567]WBQ04814.1 hypothetical protein OX958_33255 [Kribbella sp. CA-293567]
MSARRSIHSPVTALAALVLGLGVIAGCSANEQAGTPVAPSPGPLANGGGAAPVQPAPTAEGPGLTAPGIHLAAVPRGDGSFDITEDVVLRSEVTLVRLELPPSAERLVGMMRKTRPVATSLKVTADDEQALETTQLAAARELTLPVAATRFRLVYRLSGSSVRSLPSEAGRASAAIRPLTAGVDGTLPTNFRISGGGLLNASCPERTETRCAVGEPPGLGIQQGIPADQALAVLQLNLPMQP